MGTRNTPSAERLQAIAATSPDAEKVALACEVIDLLVLNKELSKELDWTNRSLDAARQVMVDASRELQEVKTLLEQARVELEDARERGVA